MTKTFKDFPVYNKCLHVVKDIESLCNNTKSGQFGFLKDQIRRASASIVLNLAEGSVKWSKKDKMNFYRTSSASASECAAAIDLFIIYNLIDPLIASKIKKQLHEILRDIQALIITIQKRKI